MPYRKWTEEDRMKSLEARRAKKVSGESTKKKAPKTYGLRLPQDRGVTGMQLEYTASDLHDFPRHIKNMESGWWVRQYYYNGANWYEGARSFWSHDKIQYVLGQGPQDGFFIFIDGKWELSTEVMNEEG